MTPEIQAEIATLRSKSLAGTLTMEDCKRAVQILRDGRVSAAHASEASRKKKAAKAPVDGAALLSELEGL